MSQSGYQPPQTFQVRLTRPNSGVPWGFRLQGGTDFNTPLSVQIVQPNSVSEQCGLKGGDGILRINAANTDMLTHEQAKQEIVRSGNEIDMLIARGAVIVWKPSVTPLSELKPAELTPIKSATGEEFVPVQRTSLVRNKPVVQEPCRIGSSHNRAARPFGAPTTQKTAPVTMVTQKTASPNVVHSQYNTPIGLYSADNIAHSYATQTAGMKREMQNLDIQDEEVGEKMSGGTYQPLPQGGTHQPLPQDGTHQPVSQNGTYQPMPQDGTNQPMPQNSEGQSETESARYKELDPGQEPEYKGYTNPHVQSRSFKALQDNLDQKDGLSSQSETESARYKELDPGQEPEYKGYTNPHVQSRSFKALQDNLVQQGELSDSSGGFRSVRAPTGPPPGEKIQQVPSMRCGGCDMLAQGVIVKARGVPYHVQCFKCASCGMNLKQKGYFVVEDKLYCEKCAKRVAQPPGGDMVAVPVYR